MKSRKIAMNKKSEKKHRKLSTKRVKKERTSPVRRSSKKKATKKLGKAFRFGSTDSNARQSNGIHWFGRVLGKLSGPVSFRYLHPPSNHPELPLVILLGDKHGQDQLCDPCEEEKGCMRVFDPSFLNRLDDLARDVPVDFFVESSWEMEEEDDPSQILFNELRKVSKACYNVAHRSQAAKGDQEICPTQFMRWHYADSRWMKARPFIEPALSGFMQYLSNTLVNRAFAVDNALPAYKLIYSREAWQGVDVQFALQVLDKLFMSDTTTSDTISSLVDLVFSYLNEHPSAVRKQLGKQSTVLAAQLRDAVVSFLENDERMVSAVSTLQEWIGLDRKLMNAFRDVIKGAATAEGLRYRVPENLRTPSLVANFDLIADVVSHITHVFLRLTGILLDLYAVARMVKPPKGSDRAILHIGYYGDLHCQTIASLLSQTLGYDIIADYPRQSDNCIQFSQPIYLERDVEELARQRYQEYPELLEQYRDVIRRESSGRLQM